MNIYVESEISQDQQKHQGWFWNLETQTFLRWDDFIEYGDE